MNRIEITTEMTTGHKFTDVIYADDYDRAFIEDIVMMKATKRGFKESEVDDYRVMITNTI